MSRILRVRWYVLFLLVVIVLVVAVVLSAAGGQIGLAVCQATALILFVSGVMLLRQDRRRELERGEILLTISEGLASRLALGDLLDYIVHSLLKMVPLADKCVIHLLDESGRRLYPYNSSQPDWQQTLGMPAGKGIAGQALKTLSTQVVGDVRNSTDFLPLRSSGDLRSLLVAPLHAHGKALGTISLNSNTPGAFTDQDKQLVTTLAAQASTAVFQSQLYTAAQNEKQHVETLLNNLDDGLVVLDGEDRILRYNFVMAHLLGVRGDEMIGEHLDRQSHNRAVRRLAQIVDTESHELQESYQRQVEIDAPSRAILAVQVSPFADAENGWRRLVSVHDKTRELDLLRNKSAVLSSASNELECVAHTIQGYATLMASLIRSADERISTWTQEIGDQSQHLATLAADLRDLAAIDTEELDIHLESVDLGALVSEVLAYVQQETIKKRVTIQPRLRPNLPEIPLDRERLRRVLLHLLEDALYRSMPGGEITLKVEANLEELAVTVADNGQPLSAETRARIFHSVYRVSGSEQRDPARTCLGLYASRRIIEAHRGHLWMADNGRGCNKFQFILPLTLQELPRP